MTKKLIGVGERPTARITAEQIHKMMNKSILPGDVVRYKILGHELENIDVMQCFLMPDSLSYELAWRTKQGVVHKYVLPDEMHEDDLTALLVAMRMS